MQLNLFIHVCEFFQDDASGVLHSDAVCVEAAGGSALVPGSPIHPDLLPGKWWMEISEDLREDNWQGFTVSVDPASMNEIQKKLLGTGLYFISVDMISVIYRLPGSAPQRIIKCQFPPLIQMC